MPLQNRVTPYGDVVALAGRGLMMGNRGVLHDVGGRIVRPWQVRRWIACVTEFRGRRRRVMQPNRYTELFFLDEAAALAAGHRPCAECRHADYQRFRELWEACFGIASGAADIDAALHASRLAGKRKRTYRDDLADVPEGAYVELDGRPWLLWQGTPHAWSDRGYLERRARPPRVEVDVLTPAPTVGVLRAGFRPAVHPSAERGGDASVHREERLTPLERASRRGPGGGR